MGLIFLIIWVVKPLGRPELELSLRVAGRGPALRVPLVSRRLAPTAGAAARQPLGRTRRASSRSRCWRPALSIVAGYYLGTIDPPDNPAARLRVLLRLGHRAAVRAAVGDSAPARRQRASRRLAAGGRHPVLARARAESRIADPDVPRRPAMVLDVPQTSEPVRRLDEPCGPRRGRHLDAATRGNGRLPDRPGV